MNSKVRIEIDAETAEQLNAQAEARGISVSDLVAELVGGDMLLAPDLDAMRAAGEGAWSKEALAEDARIIAEVERTREAVPWEDVKTWMESWGTAKELPPPKPRKV
ncbi:hypothetical protein [Tardiphaga sp.]|jgi:hypothetical protein|uniref:hypothetical protein n=1 Tax=Tardiphaga sp. TaxID=1926292 RepID=UPI0037DA7301